MGKRKNDQDESDSDESVNFVDVDFEFFDPNPKVDYHALHRLIRQLFQTDVELLHPEALADLILSQPLVGTTVKTDGIESDPYAVLTVLNMQVHQNHPSIQALREYFITKAGTEFQQTLYQLLGPNSTEQVGFVFCERLINMPVQIVPHMYSMLANEIKWAVDDNEPYRFSHLLVVSRTYKLSAEEEDGMIAEREEPEQPAKKQKKIVQGEPLPAGGTYSFHPEDTCLQKFASFSVDYPFASSEPREKDAFGLDTGGRIILLTADKLPALIESMKEAFPSP